ncbi:MAG: hypothetical protein IJL06_03110 [Kiritimatiellae bacterium]|nr:hypothetical protein [Kiritimatiellia bacterium]
MFRFLRSAAPFAALVLAFAPAAASAAPRPFNPTAAGALQPRLLSDYERRVLSHELVKLMEDVRSRRAEAAEDESLAPLREALDAAKAEGTASNVQAAARALSDAVETKLYEDPEVPPKIKRLQEVGNLLEYDSRLRREQRASHPVVDRALPDPPAGEGGSGEGNPSGPDGEDGSAGSGAGNAEPSGSGPSGGG